MAAPKAAALKPSEVEIVGFTLPANIRLYDSDSSKMVGQNFSAGMNVGGVVKRMTQDLMTGIVTMYFENGGRIFVCATGMVTSELPVAETKP